MQGRVQCASIKVYILETSEEHTQRAGEGSRHGCFIGQANEAPPDVREADTGETKEILE